MSRFDNLEFGPRAAPEPSREVIKDEAYYLAEAYEMFYQGRYDIALRTFSKVLEYHAGNTLAWTGQVRMLIELEELREAKLWADKALERFPTNPELLAAKAVALARMAELGNALAFSDAAIEERGNTGYVWLARGDVLLARKEKRAPYCFDQAMTLTGGDWFHCWLASRIHLFHRSFASALRYAQTATELAPGRAVVWLQAGQCHVALGMSARARAAFEQALQLDATCPGAEIALRGLGGASKTTDLWRRMKGLFS